MRKTERPNRISTRQRYRFQLQLWLIALAFGKQKSNLKILDLGTEFGWTGQSVRAVYPNAHLEGIELHKPTFDECIKYHEETYDALHLGCAIEFMKNTKAKWDAIICAELIEHLKPEQGIELLKLCKDKSELSIFTSPIGFAAQGAMYGNPHQRHISGWEPEDFGKAGYKTFALFKMHNLGVYAASRTGKI